MWWPRPRWKNDFLARFILLVSITAATTSNVVMADEGERCDGSDMSAVIWTMVLCTMLLVLIVVVMYFLYCKKREHDWSSLWWKSNSDKNIVLQTSPPTNGQQQKIGGTDNPAFLADSCVVGRVTKTGSTKIVHVSSLNDGLLGAELSIKEENGRKIFLCKHNDGSKDRLVAVRLVFGDGQQLCGPSSDLSRALVQLSREYGLQVELETEEDATSSAAVAGQNGDGPESHAIKSNLLSTVRGTAQRLWHQRPIIFKSGNGGGHADARDQKNRNDDDVESGNVAVATDVVRAPTREQKSPCVVTTVNETTSAAMVQSSRNCNGKSLQYRTLEYGASAADDMTQSCPDSSIQCCVVNSSEPATTMTVKATTVKSASPDDDLHAVVTPEKDASFAVAVKDTAAAVAMVTVGDKDATEKVCPTTIDGGNGETKPVEVMKNDNGPKHAVANPPPPPPPRKYSASVVSSVPATVAVPRAATDITTSAASATTTVTGSVDTVAAHAVGSPSTIAVDTDPLPVVSLQQAPPVKTSPPTAENEIRIDDDYYWCTTTTMAAPMSSFGKRPSLTGAVSEHNDVRGTRTNGSSAVTAIRSDVPVITPENSAASVQMDDESATLVMAAADIENNKRAPAVTVDDKTESAPADDAGVNDDVSSRPEVTAVADGGTTSIEDASLPSFSSDEDVDDDDDDDGNDNGVDGKTQFSCGSAVKIKDAVVMSPDIGGCNGDVTAGEVRKGGAGEGDGHKPDVKADCNGNSRNNEDGVAAAVRVSADLKSPTKLPTLRLSLSSPLQSSTATTSCCSSSASSTSSTSSSPTNNGSNNNNSPIVSKIPVRRQSAGSTSSISNGGGTVSMSLTSNGSAKKSIPLPLSRSGSRLAMWSSVN